MFLHSDIGILCLTAREKKFTFDLSQAFRLNTNAVDLLQWEVQRLEKSLIKARINRGISEKGNFEPRRK